MGALKTHWSLRGWKIRKRVSQREFINCESGKRDGVKNSEPLSSSPPVTPTARWTLRVSTPSPGWFFKWSNPLFCLDWVRPSLGLISTCDCGREKNAPNLPKVALRLALADRVILPTFVSKLSSDGKSGWCKGFFRPYKALEQENFFVSQPLLLRIPRSDI